MLALLCALCLSPGVNVGSNAGSGWIAGRMQSRGCVSGGVDIVYRGCDAAGAVVDSVDR